MMKRFATLLTMLFALSAGGAAFAGWFDDWDTDGDDLISQEEYGAGWEENGIYDNWDADGDGLLSEDEFADGYWESADSDGDSYLSDNEGDAGLFDI